MYKMIAHCYALSGSPSYTKEKNMESEPSKTDTDEFKKELGYDGHFVLNVEIEKVN